MATRRRKKEMKMRYSHIGRALSPAAGLKVPPIRIISVPSQQDGGQASAYICGCNLQMKKWFLGISLFEFSSLPTVRQV
jgi:hypothetical protein